MDMTKWGVGAASAALVFGGLLSGCGGSSSSSDTPVTPVTNTAIGIFVDAPVKGLSYAQEGGLSGVTGDDGDFEYDMDAGLITFSVGNVIIGAVAGASRVTPYDFADGSGENETAVNIAQFLQSLDTDGDPSNGIDVTGAADVLTNVSLDFNLAGGSFQTQLETVLGGTGYVVVNRGDAQAALVAGTVNEFSYAEIENRVFYFRVGDSDSFDDRGIITFEVDGAERFGGIDNLSDFEENGGTGYGQEFTWSINASGQIELYIDDVAEDMDIITRLSSVSVNNTTRYLVEFDPYDVAGTVIASLTVNIPFTEAGVQGIYDLELEVGGDPVVLDLTGIGNTGSITFSPEVGGDPETEHFDWSVDPDQGVLVLDFGPLEDGFQDIIFIARFGGDDDEFFGIYIGAEVDNTEADRPSFFADGSPLTATKRLP